ncbi:MAG TPA: hypothetical protein VFN05_18215 [Actinomycetes bacterium]|nr:hypothetical protein [Actinomycetes bacterium]
MYGNLVVVPAEPGYWPVVDRELVLTVDDLLVEEGRIAPFGPTETSDAALGRFGNLLLTGGDPELWLPAQVGEVVRWWLTNTASTWVVNLGLAGARLKLVGGDSGRVEPQEFGESVVLGPSERAVVDGLVERPGELGVEHRTPERVYRLAVVTVAGEGAGSGAGEAFAVLGHAPELVAERQGLDRWVAAEPDKVLALVAQMDDPAALPDGAGPVALAARCTPRWSATSPGAVPGAG